MQLVPVAVLICLSFVAAVFVIFTHSPKPASLLQVSNEPTFFYRSPVLRRLVWCAWLFPFRQLTRRNDQAQPPPPPLIINGVKYVAVPMPAGNAPMLALPAAKATRIVAPKPAAKVRTTSRQALDSINYVAFSSSLQEHD
jgi:hypothetical protein